MDAASARHCLVHQLRLAYSGELAAAKAYAGHWRSLRTSDPAREGIRQIERDEWEHRKCVGQMLHTLGAAPSGFRELRSNVIGTLIGWACFVSGWFFPMMGAGRLEARNIVEYEHAARYALAAGFSHLVEPLLHMAEVEWDHERFFRLQAMSHKWIRIFPVWPAPPARSEIRASFSVFARETNASQLSAL